MRKVKISDAKALVKKYNQQAIVILGIEKNGTIRTVTFGEDKIKCKAIGEWGKSLVEHGLSLIPFQTVFGWGNDGKSTTKETLSDYFKQPPK